ncbi:MAG: hypothetical protein OXI53_02005 [Nitrospira sp.]|nr:hypothetical protein [Nitrospira sp.]MDE0487527.1 hypothetical protein [Nitrospira sp.]
MKNRNDKKGERVNNRRFAPTMVICMALDLALTFSQWATTMMATDATDAALPPKGKDSKDRSDEKPHRVLLDGYYKEDLFDLFDDTEQMPHAEISWVRLFSNTGSVRIFRLSK